MKVPQWYEDQQNPMFYTTRAQIARWYWGAWPYTGAATILLIAAVLTVLLIIT